MYKRLYNSTIKKYAEKAGVHSDIQDLHFHVFNKLSGQTDITREELRHQADTVYEFGDQKEIKITPYKDILTNCNFSEIMEVDNIFTFKRPFVAEVHNGRILRGSGLCTTSDYDILLDSDKSRKARVRGFLSFEDVINKKKHYLLNENSRYDFDRAIAFTSAIRQNRPSNFTNYYVWVHNYLTRIEGLRQYEEITGKTPQVILPQNSPDWAVESLEMFGYGDNISFWNPKNELKIRRLIVPSNRRIESIEDRDFANSKFLPPNVCDWLRREAIHHNTIKENRYSNKIFITRTDASGRRIENRDKVINHLHNKGYSSYELSELSFQDQISLFTQADEVIGVHGAGLVNMIFSSNCKVKEIFGDVFIPTYYLLSQSCGHNYQAISGKSIPKQDVPVRHQNVRVEPNLL